MISLLTIKFTFNFLISNFNLIAFIKDENDRPDVSLEQNSGNTEVFIGSWFI